MKGARSEDFTREFYQTFNKELTPNSYETLPPHKKGIEHVLTRSVRSVLS